MNYTVILSPRVNEPIFKLEINGESEHTFFLRPNELTELLKAIDQALAEQGRRFK